MRYPVIKYIKFLCFKITPKKGGQELPFLRLPTKESPIFGAVTNPGVSEQLTLFLVRKLPWNVDDAITAIRYEYYVMKIVGLANDTQKDKDKIVQQS